MKGYKIERTFCRGGMADILLLRDRDGQHAILRRLRPVRRWQWVFRRQFQAGLRIRKLLGDHPHIVRQLTTGGLLHPYEVIEYVPGETLKHLINQRNNVIRRRPFAVLEQAARGVAFLHASGYLHLDVKPENFLVHVYGDSCQVKLTDFDFCQPISTQVVSRRYGGSLAYCPPEFLSEKRVSVQTDVFAFGVMAYLVFTGQMPFVQSSMDLMRNHDHAVQLQKSDQITPPIEAFLKRCLDLRLEFRYSDFQMLIRGLEKAAELHFSEVAAQKKDRSPLNRKRSAP